MNFKIGFWGFLLGTAILANITDGFKSHNDAKVKIAEIKSENKKK